MCSKELFSSSVSLINSNSPCGSFVYSAAVFLQLLFEIIVNVTFGNRIGLIQTGLLLQLWDLYLNGFLALHD